MVRKDLLFMQENTEYMKLCLDVSVYWTGSVIDHASGVLNFYYEALEAIGPKLKFYATEEMSHAKSMAIDTLQLLPKWLDKFDRSKEILTLNLESNDKPNLPSNTSFDFWAVEHPDEPAGMMRLVLPVTFIEQDPEILVKLAKRLIGEMDFHSGHGGFSINWDHKGDYATKSLKEMATLSRRYPGIDLPDPITTLMVISHGLKRINWITLIGNSLRSTNEKVNSELEVLKDIEIILERLPRGLLILAGHEPKLGDVNRSENIESYHKVGRVVSPLRCKDHPPFLLNQKGFVDEELNAEWFAYFDK